MGARNMDSRFALWAASCETRLSIACMRKLADRSWLVAGRRNGAFLEDRAGDDFTFESGSWRMVEDLLTSLLGGRDSCTGVPRIGAVESHCDTATDPLEKETEAEVGRGLDWRLDSVDGWRDRRLTQEDFGRRKGLGLSIDPPGTCCWGWKVAEEGPGRGGGLKAVRARVSPAVYLRDRWRKVCRFDEGLEPVVLWPRWVVVASVVVVTSAWARSVVVGSLVWSSGTCSKGEGDGKDAESGVNENWRSFGVLRLSDRWALPRVCDRLGHLECDGDESETGGAD